MFLLLFIVVADLVKGDVIGLEPWARIWISKFVLTVGIMLVLSRVLAHKICFGWSLATGKLSRNS